MRSSYEVVPSLARFREYDAAIFTLHDWLDFDSISKPVPQSEEHHADLPVQVVTLPRSIRLFRIIRRYDTDRYDVRLEMYLRIAGRGGRQAPIFAFDFTLLSELGSHVWYTFQNSENERSLQVVLARVVQLAERCSRQAWRSYVDAVFSNYWQQQLQAAMSREMLDRILTDLDAAYIRRGHEVARAAAVERHELKQEAYNRSRELLLRFLTPQQRSGYERNKSFEVIGNVTKNVYRVHEFSTFNVQLLDDKKSAVVSLCLAVERDVPLPDQMLVQMQLLQHDERRFLATANRSDHRVRQSPPDRSMLYQGRGYLPIFP